MGLLSPIILILLSAVDRIGNQLTMCDSITTQFVGNNLPWLAAGVLEKAQALRSLSDANLQASRWMIISRHMVGRHAALAAPAAPA